MNTVWVFRFTLRKNHLVDHRTEEQQIDNWGEAHDYSVMRRGEYTQQGFEIVRFSFSPKGAGEQNVFSGLVSELDD